MAATGEHGQVSPPIGTDVEIKVEANNLFERISGEEIWACTSCRACDEKLSGQYRNSGQDSGHAEIPHSDGKRLSGRAGGAFRGMENNANPWNMNNGERANWAADIDVEVVDPSDPFDHEYLYWVGCRII